MRRIGEVIAGALGFLLFVGTALLFLILLSGEVNADPIPTDSMLPAPVVEVVPQQEPFLYYRPQQNILIKRSKTEQVMEILYGQPIQPAPLPDQFDDEWMKDLAEELCKNRRDYDPDCNGE
jgi:hypothetical protein